MSDSFADLWSSSAPLPPKPKPQTLASASSSSNQPQKSTNSSKSDLFSLLASSGSNQQRYGSPNSAVRGTEKRSNAGTPSPVPPVSFVSSSSRGGGDAFGDLFASSSSSAAAGGSPAGMTIAARMAMEAQQKNSANGGAGFLPQKTNVPAHDSAWERLDSLVAARDDFGGIQPPNRTTTSRKVDVNDDWGLGDFASSTIPSTTSSKSIPVVQPQPRLGKPPSKTTTVSPWDLDEFASTPSPLLSRSPSQLKTDRQKSMKTEGHFDSPDVDFDFGNREDVPPEPHTRGTLVDFDGAVDDDFGRGQREGLLDSFGDGSAGNGIGRPRDEDDFLGILSKPVEVVKAQTQTRPSPSTLSREASPNSVASPGNRNPRSTIKASSPPPHIVGQIVEMGFDVDQARKALAKTKGGVDVQAALELLLGGSVSDNRSGSSRSRIEDQEDMPARTRSAPKGFKEREKERIERIRRERERESSTPPNTDVLDVQDHADRLISQASEIGLSVLTKASAFWKEGKERVAKAYEERAAGVVQKDRGDGKPKWMMEGPTFTDEDDEQGGWKDNLKGKHKAQQEPEQHVHLQENYVEQRPEVDLFDDGPIRAHPPRQRLAASRTSTPPSRPTATAPSPPITRERPLPKTSASILSTANKHRTAGTSQFKLGQYASAVESYTAAIASLPEGHLLLVPLLNNRAIARMKIGEYKGASEDAGRALKVLLIIDDGCGGVDGFDPTANSPVQITLSSWNPSVESPFVLTAAQQKENGGGWTHLQGLGVDLVDGYVKALRRRAEASEGRERWTEALRDWDVLSAGDAGWVKEHVRKEAHRGAARCRKMMNEGSEMASPASKPKPKPPVTRPKPVQAVPAVPSTALRSLQATTAQAEADENLKFQLKDSVDAKLSAWRGGKESNIRALLASLDMVLWEEILRGVKVGGLHELVTPIQVKKGYMKAIGRVHPDKLNAQNSTVEQRMLANGVFGTLNEAWIAFQSSNGM